MAICLEIRILAQAHATLSHDIIRSRTIELGGIKEFACNKNNCHKMTLENSTTYKHLAQFVYIFKHNATVYLGHSLIYSFRKVHQGRNITWLMQVNTAN